MTASLPQEIQAVFDRFVTTEFTTIDGSGQPITWPLTPYYRPGDPCIDVTTGLGYPKKADDAAERFKKPLGVLDGALAGRPYLLGEGFSVADLNVASVMAWAPLGGLDLGSGSNAQAWMGRCTGRPALARVQQQMG